MKRARLLGVGLVVLLLCAGWGLTAVLAQGDSAPPAGGPSIQSPEYEPNDSIWQANYSNLGFTWHAKINRDDDVDYYGYYVYAGMPLDLYVEVPPGSPVVPVVSLYDWSEALLAQATCPTTGLCLSYTHYLNDNIYVKVEDANGDGGRRYEYAITFKGTDVYEPNDFMSQATPIAYGDTLVAIFNGNSDVDYYWFDGEAGDDVRIETYGNVRLLDEDGNSLNLDNEDFALVGRLPADGTYYLEVYYPYCGDCVYQLSLSVIDRPIFLSLDGGGTVGGVPFTSGDILRHWMQSGVWEMYFDASDMGLKGNLVAFNLSYAPQLVYQKTQNVPGLGQVGPNDIIDFHANSFGEDTTGWLDWAFDGSDVGLDTKSESIDALANYSSSNYLLISTTGTARVPFGADQLVASNKDVLFFNNTGGGPNTTGYWDLYDGGVTLDVGAANLTGMDLQDWDDLYVSFDRRVVLDGVALDAGDIALCQLVWYMSGCESVQKYFDASDSGLRGVKIDAFDVSPDPYPYPYP